MHISLHLNAVRVYVRMYMCFCAYVRPSVLACSHVPLCVPVYVLCQLGASICDSVRAIVCTGGHRFVRARVFVHALSANMGFRA